MSIDSFANIFSHSEGCLFVLFMVSFAVQKLLSLSPVWLFLVLFLLLYEMDQKKNPSANYVESILPVFSSKNFIVSGLTLRSLIHFDFIFVYGIRECSNFILLYVSVQILQHHLLTSLSFLHYIFLPPLS